MNAYRRGLKRCLGHQIVVDTKDGHTYRGTLRVLFKDSLLLAAVEFLNGEESIPLKGDKGVPWHNLSTWQEV